MLSIQQIARDVRAVSVIEFALGAPVIIVLLLVGFDITRFTANTHRIQTVAATIGQMVTVNIDGQLSPSDLQFYKDSTMVIFPQVLQDSARLGISWTNDISITVSQIDFSGSAAPYVAMTKWSVGPQLRPCNYNLQPVADTASPTPTTLPTDTFGPGSMIVVDVVFLFRPTIASSLLGSIPIVRSFYVQPRYVTTLNFTAPASSTVNQC